MKKYKVTMKSGREYVFTTSNTHTTEFDLAAREAILRFGFYETFFKLDDVEAVILLPDQS